MMLNSMQVYFAIVISFLVVRDIDLPVECVELT